MIEQIRRLATLSEEIVERELYPVSYFSQAFDITNKIQEDLHQIELFQIELFEKQMKEHQVQVHSTIRHSIHSATPDEAKQAVTISPPQPEKETIVPHEYPDMRLESVESVIKPPSLLFSQQEMSALEITPTPPPVQEKKTASFEKNNLIDLKKVITLNDRFLFRRELFANDDNLMNQTISALNDEASYDDSIEYLKRHFDWNFNDEHVTDFLAVLKKRFS